MKHIAKEEIPHEELDKVDSSASGRYKKIGSEHQGQTKDQGGQIQNVTFILQDKVIYKINVCPYCSSETTFHRRIQDNKDVIGNVWRTDVHGGEGGYSLRKFDYCLDCRREFLIELYIWKKK